jgi:DNA-binding transcriptional LysR family regulator
MIDRHDLPRFLMLSTVARLGTLTAAARELGVSKSVVSEQLRALEAQYGLRLLERTTRCLRPTQAGLRILAATAALEAAAAALSAAIETERGAPVGTLRVATTLDLGPRLVASVAARLAVEHPGVDVDLVMDDRPTDLVAGGFDLAVRLGAPQISERVAIHLADVREPIVAAPGLAERWVAGRPRDLAGAPWVRHAALATGEVLTFHGPGGESDTVAVRTRARANAGEGVRALLLAGAGFGALPEYLVADDLRRGGLVEVCRGWIWKQVSLFAELPSSRRKPTRVSLFLDALRATLAERGLG